MSVSRRRFLETSALAAAFLSSVRTRTGLAGIRQNEDFELAELTVEQLQAGIASGRWRAEEITALYLDRIEALDRQGPSLGAIITLNPEAIEVALEQAPSRPLSGIPVLVKDNIETADRMPTTAGSLALENAYAPRDAFFIERLRDAGAIILAKSNLSEWANFRGANSTSGWSAMGGQCRNPYVLEYNPCGSSSGSAVGVSANMAPLALGTETDGSIVCPSAMNGVVGIKPTVGLVSRNGIIPIAASQDTAGPIARTVEDAARLLGAIAGPDPDDPATLQPGASFESDYTAFLDPEGLRGMRLGSVRNFSFSNNIWTHFEASLEALRDAGARIVDPVELPNIDRLSGPEYTVLLYEFRDGIDRYLARLPDEIPVHSLRELIEFNQRHVDEEMPYFAQERLRAASAVGPLTDRAYRQAVDEVRRFSRSEGIDALMDGENLDALVSPTCGLPWRTDYENGDRYSDSSSRPAAVAGYPHVTVPMGLANGLPLGISFFGRAWSEPALLRMAYAYERATAYREVPTFARDLPRP